MYAQAQLVRYYRLGSNQIGRLITKCEKHATLSARQIACVLFCMMPMLMTGVADAQFPVQQVSHQTPVSYAPMDAAAYAQLVPQHQSRLFAQDSFLSDQVFGRFSGSWMRLEYFHAKIGHRGGNPLGAPIADINGNVLDDISEPFDLPIFPGLNIPLLPILSGRAVAPTTEKTDWDDNNGIRGSFGLQLDERSWIEGSVSAIQEQAESLDVSRIPPTSAFPPIINNLLNNPIQFIVIPYTIDGQPGTLQNLPFLGGTAPIIVYDANFFSEYSVNIWSAEINHVYDLRIPHDGWKVQSIVGWRHEEYSENLTFGGTFDNQSDYATDFITNLGPLAIPQSNRIGSKVHNFRHQLQLGFRSEVEQYGITLGVEPKVALGLGLIRSTVTTQNAREPGDLSPLLNDPFLLIDDPESTREFDREIDFAPSAELNLYAKLRLTDWFKLRVGYNLTWMGRVGSADNSIRYNTISATDPTMMPDTLDFGVDQNVNSRYISSFNIGGEIILP